MKTLLIETKRIHIFCILSYRLNTYFNYLNIYFVKSILFSSHLILLLLVCKQTNINLFLFIVLKFNLT